MAIADAEVLPVATPSNTKVVNSAATVNNTLVKSAGGKVLGWNLHNKSATAVWVKFYNKASAPVAGTDTPVFAVPLAAGARSDVRVAEDGITFATGIGYAITGAATDADTTAVGAVGDVRGAILYR